MIDRNELKQQIEETSTDIFFRSVEAETKAHNTTAREVHFHEIEATDAIKDIVRVSVC